MTADVYPFDMAFLTRVANRMVNEVRGINPVTGEQVMDLLVDSARAEGTTVVIVTHDARVAAYADREAMVRDGIVITHQRVGAQA